MIIGQLLVNGAIAGALYALVAIGFALIYSTNRFVHFAHGAVAAAGAYLFFTLYATQGWPFGLALGGAMLCSGGIGLLLYALVYAPLQKKQASHVILLIASIGLMIGIENLLLLMYGASIKVLVLDPWWTEPVSLSFAVITPLQVAIIGAAIGIFALVITALRYVPAGKIMRAVAANPELALTMGVNVRFVQGVGLVVGSMLAGLAGVFFALEQNLDPFIGTNLIIGAFTASIVGGMFSLPGAILGSFLLGFAENLGIWFLPSGYKSAIAFMLLLVFLIIRPFGILGINKGTRD